MSKRKLKKKNLGILLSLVVIFCIVVVYVHKQLTIKRQSQMTYESEFTWNSYNWDYLNTDNMIYKYDDGTYESVFGIDVSYHQHEIDWAKVKQSGVEFAMIRVGYRGYSQGEIYEDEQFINNIEGAIDNDIKVGIYFFSQAINVEEAIEEADFVIKKIKKYDIDYPIAFDMEYIQVDGEEVSRIKNLSSYERSQIAITFCNRLKDAGYETMIYNSANKIMELFDLNYLQEESIWLAEYDNETNYAYLFDMWQYSSTGTIDGIDTNVDLNIYFKQK